MLLWIFNGHMFITIYAIKATTPCGEEERLEAVFRRNEVHEIVKRDE